MNKEISGIKVKIYILVFIISMLAGYLIREFTK